MKNCPNCGAPMQGQKCEYCDYETLKRRIDYIDIEHTAEYLAKNVRDLNRFEYELFVMERKIKRLWILAALLVVAILGMGTAWIKYVNQLEDVPVEIVSGAIVDEIREATHEQP